MDRWTSGYHYDQWMGRWSRLLVHEFLNWLNLPAGLRWLDVCCGSGVITEAIVERNTPAKHRSHRRLARADKLCPPASRPPERRLPNRGRYGSAFPRRQFRCRRVRPGIELHSEPASWAGGILSVSLRPGGTIAAYVWDYAQGARFLREFWDAAIAVDRQAATFDQARRFPMCTPEDLQPLFERAGLQARIPPCARNSHSLPHLRGLLGAAADRARLGTELHRYARSTHPSGDPRTPQSGSARRFPGSDRVARPRLGNSRLQPRRIMCRLAS